MADKWPLANGNWSDAANWNDGTKPVAGDDVYADGKTVAIDEDVTVASLRTSQRSGGTAGGGFTSGSRTIIADIVGGTTTLLTVSPNVTINLIGNVTCGSSSDTIVVFATGQLTVLGNVVGSSAIPSYSAINVYVDGRCTVTGNITAGARSRAITANGILAITGVVRGFAGNWSDNPGAIVIYNAAASVTITGDVYAGNQNLLGGTYSTPAISMSAGACEINGDCRAYLSPAVSATGGHLRLNGKSYCDAMYSTQAVFSRNVAIVGDSHYWDVATAGKVLPLLAGTSSRLYGYAATGVQQPSDRDVRYGTVYGPDNKLTGTCHVPSAASVLFGVPVDATVGIATIDAASIRAAMGLTSANLDKKLGDLEALVLV